jgi:NTP pyrophosphatase (non-canonical NTP hydrolase)
MISNGKEESLVILAEECGEVVQISAKIHRWGPHSNNNGRLELTNLDHLILELGDLQAMIDIVVNEWEIDPAMITKASDAKKTKLERYSTNLRGYGSTPMLPS